MDEYQKPWTRPISNEEYEIAVGIKKDGDRRPEAHDPASRPATGGDSST